MARYHALLGRRVEVHYRAGDIFLPATGTLAADSGKSIFLEEHFCQRGTVKTFRWEIPYQCIVKLGESPVSSKTSAGEKPPAPAPAPPAKAKESPGPSGLLPLKDRPKEA